MSCPEPTSSWFVQRDTSTRRWTTHREKTEKSFRLPDLHSKHEWSFMTISDIWHQRNDTQSKSSSLSWGLKLYRLFGSPQNTSQCILTTEELMILESTTKSVSAAAAFGFFLEEGPTPQLEARYQEGQICEEKILKKLLKLWFDPIQSEKNNRLLFSVTGIDDQSHSAKSTAGRAAVLPRWWK